jgi:hypothetical protein
VSFLRSDEPKEEKQEDTSYQTPNDQTSATDDNQNTPASDAVSASSNDVTVTTDEGSTLHTFNDPTLQPPQADEQTVSADPLTFQDHDGSPLTSAQPAEDETVDSTTSTPASTDSTDTNEVVDDPFATPAHSEADAPEVAAQTEEPAEKSDESSEIEESTAPAPLNPVSSIGSTSSDPELDNIKREALEQLRPLLEKVDLPANEKFDKYLMMLRATDDPTLIEPAFNAAQGISEDKEKAEALVDIINEINYVSGDHPAV